MPELATLDFNRQLERDGVPAPVPGIDMDLVRDCIHCGLCLPKCPTFRVLRHEGDSPRGRMWQIKEAALGRFPARQFPPRALPTPATEGP